MKIIVRSMLAVMAMGMLLTACDKVGDLPVYDNGVKPVLTATTTTLEATAADSLSPLVTFNWTNPQYATDSAYNKYILQIDLAGRNFSNAVSREIIGAFSTTFTGKEMNEFLLSLGFEFNVSYDIEARIVSSYGNNNDRQYSDALQMTAKPYKIPPAVALPYTGKLYIVGGSTQFDWNNTAPFPPVREFTQLDETTWGGIYNITGSGGGYLLLPEAGSWNNKYSVQDNSVPGAANGGPFGYNLPDNFPSNMSGGNGWYKMIFDFQRGRYTLTKEDNEMKQDLYVTGDATPGGWVNNPPANQKMTMLTNGVFQITMAFVPGKYYKFLNTSGAWQPQFGGSVATGGDLGANYGSAGDPPAIPTPAAAGNYKITVNFITRTYTVEAV